MQRLYVLLILFFGICGAATAGYIAHLSTISARLIEGITYTTWRERIQQTPHWRADLAEAEKIRDEVWRDHALEMVKNAMPKNWVAAMTYLERKYPNEFALRTVNRNLNSTDESRIHVRTHRGGHAEGTPQMSFGGADLLENTENGPG